MHICKIIADIDLDPNTGHVCRVLHIKRCQTEHSDLLSGAQTSNTTTI